MATDWTYRIHEGDCLDVMREMPSASVDLIITSPPYADKRKDTYGGVPASEYVEWFLPRAEQMKRLLKPTGSFVLNIKEGTQDRHRETYVLELILALVKQEWRWIDEYIWTKKNVMPGLWQERLKDGWERLLHFAPGEERICFYPDAVRVPAKESAIKRYEQAVRNSEYGRTPSVTGSKFGRDIVKAGEAMYRRTRNAASESKDTEPQPHPTALPSNVLVAPVAHTRDAVAAMHSAIFPEAIPSFFIRLLTVEGDVVLDPFSGSGTTYRVAQRAGRKPIGIEIKSEYVKQENPMLL